MAGPNEIQNGGQIQNDDKLLALQLAEVSTCRGCLQWDRNLLRLKSLCEQNNCIICIIQVINCNNIIINFIRMNLNP